MSVIPSYFKLDLEPVAHQDAIVHCGNARFTVLMDRLIRLEYQQGGDFEDKPSQAFWFRRQSVPHFTVDALENGIVIETDCLKLKYVPNDERGFTAENLSIQLKLSGVVWHPGDKNDDNLGGTTRTLDFVNGYAPLEAGLMSRAGWSVVDDSKTLILNADGWVEPRTNVGIDWYFFGYETDYKACLHDYCKISGAMPLIPRWILGNWWSRYWDYSQQDFVQLINDFAAYELPFSVCIIDMDWHITETGNSSSGWTGYTWNRELFPDPPQLIKFMHDKGLKTALNLHPAEGIHPHEEQYQVMAQRLGIAPDSQHPIAFDIASPEFTNAYFELLHHPYEEMGIDFWWLDWQQGQKSTIDGLDPLWLINHLHFHDLGRNGSRRPFIFSRWGNEGHQRYPIGFSGDTYRTWESLSFQSFMTATAANIAYGWWSHDIGGHTSGVADSELFTRWVQFGVFSPIMRIHVGKGAFYDMRPWMFENAEVLRVLREALQLRHALIPYLYTMARRAYDQSLPLVQPMYYEYPDEEAAYHCPHQYLFGSELVAAPFVNVADPDTGLSRQVVWLPEGGWYHFFTGEYFEGNRWYPIYGTLGDIPIFAKVGAILPLGPKVGQGGVNNPDEIEVHIFAGADHTFTLYEDDGESNAYRQGQYCTTTFTQAWIEDDLEFSISPSEGDLSLIPETRKFRLIIHGVKDSVQPTVTINDQYIEVESWYEESTEALHIEGIELSSTKTLHLTLQADTNNLLSRRDRKRENLLRMLRFFKLHAGVRNEIGNHIDAILDDATKLAPYLVTMEQSQAQALFEVIWEAGIHTVYDTSSPSIVVMWNNREDDGIEYRYNEAFLFFGFVKSSKFENGKLPRFQVFKPSEETWKHGSQDEHIHRVQWHAQIDYFNVYTLCDGYREKTP